jgi:DNA-directed RNA polymerase subunit RPC12/RpoP/ribosomal protein L37AE/L43A
MSNNKSVNHKCPSCHAPLKFNPKTQNWTCEYCNSTFNLKDLQEFEKKYQDKETIEEPVVKEEDISEQTPDLGEYNVYKCPDCGAQIVTDLNTAATFCVYCKNTAIIKERLTGKFEPKELIPFQKTIEDAKEAFKKVGKHHPLMPSSFNSTKNISEIRGIYIPFWLFSTTSRGGITTHCKRIRSWRRGDYVYTKTDTYSVTKDGEFTFIKVPNDGSLKFDDAIMNSIEPFNYEKLVPFSPSYLSGFLAEKYDVDSTKAQQGVVSRMRNTIINNLKTDIKGYNSCTVVSDNINFPDLNIEYVFLPVYFLNIKYNDKIYTFAMNGESGKLIGNMPVDKKKAIIAFVLTFIITFIISYLIFYLFIRSNV